MPLSWNKSPPHATGRSSAKSLPPPPGVQLGRLRPARLLRLASPVVGVFFFGLAVWSLMNSSLRTYSYDQIAAALRQLPRADLFLALLVAAAAYLILIGYDFLAFRFIRRPMPLRSMTRAALVASALSFNLGNTAVTGAALRYWTYTSLGLSESQAARVVLFCSGGFWLGYLFLAALLFSSGSIALPGGLLPLEGTTRPLGLACLAVLASYTILSARGKETRVGPWRFGLPSAGLTLGQVLVASLDICLMAATLYVLLPAGGPLTYFRFLPIFLIALVGGSVSQVPGGLGVFETVLLMLLSPWLDTGRLVASLLASRGTYYFLPLFLSLAFLAGRQGMAERPRLHRLWRQGAARLAAVAAVAMTALFALQRLLWRRRPATSLPSAAEIERARPLVEAAPQTYGHLVFRGDKALLFSPAEDAFLMYGRMGRSWVAMGDPIGSDAGVRKLAWRFRRLAEDSGGWCAFFEVREELSIDLMRHQPAAPHGTMDFLFTELLLWGQAQGFRWFNFGMAPLAGLDAGAGCPLWHHVGAFLYRHGRRYYSFDGLRRYKDKFHPVWSPLYLASPGGLALGPVLVDVTALAAGGPWGIVSKGGTVGGSGR